MNLRAPLCHLTVTGSPEVVSHSACRTWLFQKRLKGNENDTFCVRMMQNRTTETHWSSEQNYIYRWKLFEECILMMSLWQNTAPLNTVMCSLWVWLSQDVLWVIWSLPFLTLPAELSSIVSKLLQKMKAKAFYLRLRPFWRWRVQLLRAATPQAQIRAEKG